VHTAAGTALALFGVFLYSMAKRVNKSRPDLSASIRSRPPMTIERIMQSIVPKQLQLWIVARNIKKLQQERAAAKPPNRKGPSPEFEL
jgi:hypothetical protein